MLEVDQLLISGTGFNCGWWMNFIGQRIVVHSGPSDKGDYQTTDSSLWLCDVINELWKEVPKRYDLTKVDENIVCAKLLSIILTLWTSRIVRAKAHDPRRKGDDRRAMLLRQKDYVSAIAQCLTDQSHDHLFFPDQEWEDPFSVYGD